MDLSKTFDCIPHGLIIAKLAAYGLDDTDLKLIFSYLKNRKQCVHISNTYSNFENIISGVPKGSIVGPLLFDFPINDLFSSSSLSQTIISLMMIHVLLGQAQFLI